MSQRTLKEIMYKTWEPSYQPTHAPSTSPSSTSAPSSGTPKKNSIVTFTADEYIVYSTVLIFAVVGAICGVMWCARPARKSKPLAVQAQAAGGRDLEWGNGPGTTITKKTKKTKSTASATSRSTVGGKTKKKTSKTVKPDQRDESYDEEGSALETASFASEASSLLGDMAPSAVGKGSMAVQYNKPASIQGISGGKGFKELSPQDEALRRTFHSVLKEGLTMLLHTGERTAKPIQLSLVGTELRWKSVKVFARNLYKIDLRDIRYVEWGKQTNTFQKHPSMGASEDLCFSLITDKVTVDLEASSKVERDALVQGFSLVVGGLRMSGTI